MDEHKVAMLHDIYLTTADPNLDFSAKIDKILPLACCYLGLEVGILARITQGDYKVQHVYCSGKFEIKCGECFHVGKTFCNEVLYSTTPLAIGHVKESAYAEHPAYEETKLESYIGLPIIVNNEPWGTVNFSSPKPRTDFSDDELLFVELLGVWISAEIRVQLANL